MNNPHRRRFLGRGLGAAQLAVAGVLLPAAGRALATLLKEVDRLPADTLRPI